MMVMVMVYGNVGDHDVCMMGYLLVLSPHMMMNVMSK